MMRVIASQTIFRELRSSAVRFIGSSWLYTKNPKDTTGLSRGVSCLLLNRIKTKVSRCHGLAPWSRHVCCYLAGSVKLHGPRPWHPVLLLETIDVATSVILHGTSPWHLRKCPPAVLGRTCRSRYFYRRSFEAHRDCARRTRVPARASSRCSRVLLLSRTASAT